MSESASLVWSYVKVCQGQIICQAVFASLRAALDYFEDAEDYTLNESAVFSKRDEFMGMVLPDLTTVRIIKTKIHQSSPYR